MGNEYDSEGTMNDADAVCFCLCGAVVTSANAAAVIAAALVATTSKLTRSVCSIPSSHQG